MIAKGDPLLGLDARSQAAVGKRIRADEIKFGGRADGDVDKNQVERTKLLLGGSGYGEISRCLRHRSLTRW